MSMFFDKLVELLATIDTQIYIRERPIFYHIMDADRLYRVAGVADLALWKTKEKKFYEVTPTSTKKILTNNGHAGKAQVAKRLSEYVGDLDYETDDESDAIATGIAFLIREGYLDAPEFPTVPARKHTQRRTGSRSGE